MKTTAFLWQLPEAGHNVPRRDQVRVVVTTYLDPDLTEDGRGGYVVKVVLATVVLSPRSYPMVELEGLSEPFPVIPVGTRSLSGVRRRLHLSSADGSGAVVHPADHDRLALLSLRPYNR